MPKPNPEMRGQIRALRADGLDTKQIAEKLNTSPGAVLQYERRMGVPKRKRGKPANPENVARDEAVYKAREQGYSYKRIAEMYGITEEYAGVIRSKVAERKRASRTTS